MYARMLKSHLVLPSQELSEHPVVKSKYSSHQTRSLVCVLPSGQSKQRRYRHTKMHKPLALKILPGIIIRSPCCIYHNLLTVGLGCRSCRRRCSLCICCGRWWTIITSLRTNLFPYWATVSRLRTTLTISGEIKGALEVINLHTS